MKKKLTAVLLFLSMIGAAQTYYNDAKLRATLYLEKKINKKLFLYLAQQNRLDYNLSRYERASVNFGGGYKLTGNIKVEADYTYIWKASNDGSFTPSHWLSAAITFKKDAGRFKFLYRNKFQARYKQPGISNDAYIPHLYDRNKLTVKYDVNKRFDVYVAEEIYIPLNSPVLRFQPTRTRSIAGVDIKTFRHQELELYFMFQQQLAHGSWFKQSDFNKNPYTYRDFIYGVSYKITF